MNEQTITVLLQQILEQVEQLGALTEINQQQHLRDQMKRLRQRIHQLELLQRITEYTDVQVDVADVLEVGLDVVWEKAPLRFAVFILGEAQLGPYT